MCLKWFKKKEINTQGTIVIGVVTEPPPVAAPPPLTPAVVPLPHPEEPANISATISNVDLPYVMHDWLFTWAVPEDSWLFWTTFIHLYLDNTVPFAQTNAQLAQIFFNPIWCNKGTLAHEVAHVVWSKLLVSNEKSAFILDLARAKEEPIVKDLFSRNPYGLTSNVEAHAEIYRYLGDKMPDYLKKYYPRLC
jgi:hypothetical protein